MLNKLAILGPTARAPEITAAVSALAGNDDTESGAVFTRPEVVAAILQLSGYIAVRPMHRMRLLEPSFGGSEFLLAAADRLLTAFRQPGPRPADAGRELVDAIRAVEQHRDNLKTTPAHLRARLIAHGVTPPDARELCRHWLLCGLSGEFDFVVGNTPYVRQERTPEALLRENHGRIRPNVRPRRNLHRLLRARARHDGARRQAGFHPRQSLSKHFGSDHALRFPP